LFPLIYKTQTKNYGESNEGGEIQYNLKDLLDKFLHMTSGKAKRAVDLKAEGFGVLSAPFSHSGVSTVEEPCL